MYSRNPACLMFSPHAAVTVSSVVFSHYRHVQKKQPRLPVAQVLHEAQDVTVGFTGRFPSLVPVKPILSCVLSVSALS